MADSRCKYYKQKKQVSFDGGVTWYDVIPYEYQKGELYEMESQDCGYVPPVTEYRWVKTNDTTCVEEGPEVQYRWVNMDASVDYYCEGTTKYYKQKKQVSFDGGQTWRDVVPAEYQKGGVAETESTDCGYVPPTPTGKKLVANYSDGKVLNVDCDSNTELTLGDVRRYGYNFTAMTSAVIGDCVTSIGDEAFGEVGGGSYCACYNLTSCTIPNSVTNIGAKAFFSCTSLTDVTIPDSVTSIGGAAFGYCTSLTSVNLPNSVTTLGGYAFNSCSGLRSATIGNGVTSIGDWTFYHCYNLTSCTIGSGVTSIGSRAFDSCSLTSVTIPNSVTTIGDLAFGACTSLTSVTIPDSVTSISNAFYGCSGLRSVDIPNSVTSIGNSAFSKCSSLTSITIPNSVTTIGDNAFQGCTSLTSVTIPDSVTNIGGDVFYNCSGLTTATIGSGVTYIGGYTFASGASLTSITINATTPPTLEHYPFYGEYPIYVPCESMIAYQTAEHWSSYKSRIKCSSYKYIATYSDTHTESGECDSTSAITDSEITKTDLVSVEISDCVTTISTYAFSGYKSLTSIALGNSVTTIGDWAFRNCDGLTSINILSGVTSIGIEAFYSCDGLTSVTVNATTPPRLGAFAFKNTNNCPIYVPRSSVSAYKSNWTDYASRIQPIP